MQSGISASRELVSQFGELLSSDRHFGLIVTIADESLVPAAVLRSAGAGASFDDQVACLLAPHIKPDTALYAILRRYPESAPSLAAITYVPDAAPVRQKMLFASTRSTLVRELGTEHFRDTLFATTPDELTPAGFARHDAHAKLAAPLTDEEKSLGDVKRAEQEAGSGTGTREMHLSQSISMPIAEDALGALKGLAQEGGRRLVMIKINPDSELIELVPDSASPSSISELTHTISPTEPRFSFYRYEHTHDGQASSPLLFFYTCPPSTGMKAIRFRMLYPLMKKAVLAIAERDAGLQVARRFEVEEPKEITEQTVLADLHPQVEARKGFSRPKRPGR